jgi:hypothetical protein
MFRAVLIALLSIAIAGPLAPVQIPKTWDAAAVTAFEIPLADPAASPEHVTAEYYYAIPARPIYRSYPVYHPDREPPGYLDRIKQHEPEIAFDPSQLRTDDDWIQAGKLVFEAPNSFEPVTEASAVRDRSWYDKAGIPVAADGTVPFFRYVVRKKGVVERSSSSCAECHTRVMPDGTVLAGAQGNFPFERAGSLTFRGRGTAAQIRRILRGLYDAPWVKPDPLAPIEQMSLDDLAALGMTIPPGVMARQGASPFFPAQVPDLIGVRERRYLDHTGHVRQFGIADLMRYSAANQGLSSLARYGHFRPIDLETGKLPEASTRSRYSDEQLYALALYLYSLQPPRNPNRSDAVAEQGQKIFTRDGCATCHTPPLYTNNMLTPAEGFTPPPEHSKRLDVLAVSVGTDPGLALRTRRGTGYYKVPSLKGLWYRGPLEHSGSVATLEDWFDPRRLLPDYVPTGFRGYGVKTRAIAGHRFGLGLSDEERKALIAFLKTL